MFEQEGRSKSISHIMPDNVGFMSATSWEGQWLNKDNPFVKTYKVNRQIKKLVRDKDHQYLVEKAKKRIISKMQQTTIVPFGTTSKRELSVDLK